MVNVQYSNVLQNKLKLTFQTQQQTLHLGDVLQDNAQCDNGAHTIESPYSHPTVLTWGNLILSLMAPEGSIARPLVIMKIIVTYILVEL
jgi:hypothetical protein